MKSLRLPGSPLSIRFFQCRDRWHHEFVLDCGDHETVVMRSIEGNDDDHWPPSPPIQEVEFHELSQGRNAILAIGRAGVGHWSMSCSVEEPDTFKNRACIFVDNACLLSSKTTGALAKLESTYRVPSDVEFLKQSDTEILLSAQGGQMMLELIGNCEFQFEDRNDGRQLSLFPREVQFEKRKSNRWGFRVSMDACL